MTATTPIAPSKHPANPLADELISLSEQQNQCHCTRGFDHMLESFIGQSHCQLNFSSATAKNPITSPQTIGRVSSQDSF